MTSDRARPACKREGQQGLGRPRSRLAGCLPSCKVERSTISLSVSLDTNHTSVCLESEAHNLSRTAWEGNYIPLVPCSASEGGLKRVREGEQSSQAFCLRMPKAADKCQAAWRIGWRSSLRRVLQVRRRCCLCAEAVSLSFVHLPSM